MMMRIDAEGVFVLCPEFVSLYICEWMDSGFSGLGNTDQVA